MFAVGDDLGFRRGKFKTCGFPKIPHRTRIRNAIPDFSNEVVVVCVVHNVKRLMKKASRSESEDGFFLGSGECDDVLIPGAERLVPDGDPRGGGHASGRPFSG